MKSIKKLAIDLCHDEGGKKEVDIAQMSQILSKLSLKIFKQKECDRHTTLLMFVNNGYKIQQKILKEKIKEAGFSYKKKNKKKAKSCKK